MTNCVLITINLSCWN